MALCEAVRVHAPFFSSYLLLYCLCPWLVGHMRPARRFFTWLKALILSIKVKKDGCAYRWNILFPQVNTCPIHWWRTVVAVAVQAVMILYLAWRTCDVLLHRFHFLLASSLMCMQMCGRLVCLSLRLGVINLTLHAHCCPVIFAFIKPLYVI